MFLHLRLCLISQVGNAVEQAFWVAMGVVLYQHTTTWYLVQWIKNSGLYFWFCRQVVYAACVHPRCVGGLHVPLVTFVLTIMVSDGAVSLLVMMEEPSLELVPPLEVAQGVNTWRVV